MHLSQIVFFRKKKYINTENMKEIVAQRSNTHAVTFILPFSLVKQIIKNAA